MSSRRKLKVRGASGESSSGLKTGQERKLNEIGGDKRGITELNCAKLQY